MGRPKIAPVERVCPWCGSAFLTPRHTRKRFCSKHCSGSSTTRFRGQTGPRNNRFNNGLSSWDGRSIIVCRDGSWIFWYRAVMEMEIGRPLRPDEIVHHRNGDPADDRVENLQIVTRAEHIGIHREDLRKPRKKAAA